MLKRCFPALGALCMALGLLFGSPAHVQAEDGTSAALSSFTAAWEALSDEERTAISSDAGACYTDCGSIGSPCEEICLGRVIGGHHPHCPCWCPGPCRIGCDGGGDACDCATEPDNPYCQGLEGCSATQGMTLQEIGELIHEVGKDAWDRCNSCKDCGGDAASNSNCDIISCLINAKKGHHPICCYGC